MKNKFNLDREFIKWFYEDEYPDQLNNRAMVMARIPMLSTEQRDYFMRQAFKAGAASVGKDTIFTLGMWATACEGLDPELVAPAEVFDRAQENLDIYYKEQMELFK